MRRRWRRRRGDRAGATSEARGEDRSKLGASDPHKALRRLTSAAGASEASKRASTAAGSPDLLRQKNRRRAQPKQRQIVRRGPIAERTKAHRRDPHPSSLPEVTQSPLSAELQRSRLLRDNALRFDERLGPPALTATAKAKQPRARAAGHGAARGPIEREQAAPQRGEARGRKRPHRKRTSRASARRGLAASGPIEREQSRARGGGVWPLAAPSKKAFAPEGA